ncbi:MAG: hypothetical protein WD398_12810 [Cyclobacteriaceae bacterium]
MKTTFLALIFTLFFMTAAMVQAQVHVGVYQEGILNHIGAGTDPENKLFGEVRLLAGGIVNSVFGIETLGHYNFQRKDWYNLHAGLMLGYYDFDEGSAGLPLGLSFKPIINHRQFSVLLEGMPMYGSESFALRALVGLRYTFRKAD